MKMYDYSIDSGSVNPARILPVIRLKVYITRDRRGKGWWLIVTAEKGFSL